MTGYQITGGKYKMQQQKFEQNLRWECTGEMHVHKTF